MEKSKSRRKQTAEEAVPWWTSCRFTLCMLSFLAAIVLYLLRNNMSVAIVCMTRRPDVNKTANSTNSSSSYTNGGQRIGEFTWSRKLQGFVLSSYYLGYIVTQFPGGFFANRFGAKPIIGIGMTLITLLTFITPIAARVSVHLLMVVQAFKGLSTGIFFPTFYQMYGRWAPPNERSVLLSIFGAGTPLGNIFSSIFSGILCEKGFDGGWPSIFYIFGVVGIVWCVVWFFMAYSFPEEHPRISEVELDYIQKSLPSVTNTKTLHVPWRAMLTTVPVYALFVTDVCYVWCWYVAITTLPMYMKDVLKFDIKSNGLFNSLPYLANFIVSILSSILADFILTRNMLNRTLVRKLFTTAAMIPSIAVSIGVGTLKSEQRILAVSLLTLWVGLMGFARSGTYINHLDLAPRYSGVLMGIDNTLKTIPGIVAPTIVAAMTPNGAAEEWQKVFRLGACIASVGWITYMIFGSAKEQEWARSGTPHVDESNIHGQSLESPDKEYSSITTLKF